MGPPGTGKTDVAVQIISNIYHNFPEQRTLLVTHSNQVGLTQDNNKNIAKIFLFFFLFIFFAFDVGSTLPNTDLSRDFMGLVVDGSMDLGTQIWHPPQIFCRGG